MSFYANNCNHVGGIHYEYFPPRCSREKGHDLPHSVRADLPGQPKRYTIYWDDDGFMLQVQEGKQE